MKKILTIILDGFGYREEEKGNAILAAHMKTFTELWNKYPHALLEASEEAVGLSKGQAGNSEVGHMTIGAGRLLKQSEMLVNDFLKEPDMENANVIKLLENKDKDIHIMGLCSDGNIHAGVDDFLSMYKFLIDNGFTKIHFHLITDGRDTGVHDAMKYINIIKDVIKQYGVGDITSICGRFYAMDRDKRWDREKLAYDAMVNGIGNKFKTVQKAVENSYEAQEFDEFVKPIVITDEEGNEIAKIKDKDSVIFFNFRPDRARQIVRVITEPDFSEFETVKMNNLYFVTMTEYDETLSHVHVAYKPQALKNTLGEVLSNRGYTQVRCAETEKYAHVTFFFNGGEEKQYKGEDRILVASPKVATYDLKPEMSAYEVTDKIIDAIESKKYDVIIMNYANGDMVGHTGIIEKAIEAVEALDTCVGKVISKLEEVGGEALITADHGNCEYMLDLKTGEAITSHSTFDVPLIVVSDRVKSLKNGRLCDLAPTLLALMGEEKPSEMTGESLVEL